MYEHFDTIQDISLPRVSVECFVSCDLGVGGVVLYIVIVYDDREGTAHDFIIDDRDDLSFGEYANEFVDLFGSPKYVATVGIDTGERASQLVVIFFLKIAYFDFIDFFLFHESFVWFRYAKLLFLPACCPFCFDFLYAGYFIQFAYKICASLLGTSFAFF